MACVGYLLIVMAGVGMGWYAAHRLRRRADYIQQAARWMQALEQQIGFTALPMATLWWQMAAAETYARYQLLQDTARLLPTTPFEKAYTAAVERADRQGLLTPAGRQLLLEFGVGCGRYDLTRQEDYIRHYGSLFTALAEQLSDQAAVKGRLYRMLGTSGGVLLALLFL